MADIQAGKALWEAGIDRSKVASDAAAVNADIAAEGAKGEAAATASATSTLAKVGGLARAAASTVALGAGAMFGVATKLASEGEDAMAKFQAQTGATADEAKTAFDSMNRLAGQNLQSFGTVADTFTQVTTNLGLAGKAAEDATNLILKFSTATGTDAVANVSAFDDVLDSWHMTADQLPGIMDQLIASTQKYGGSVTEAQDAVAKMAPQVQALGGTFQDAVGILDLFRASGLDAAGAQKALNAAITHIPKGQTLDDVLQRLAAIPNKGQRATEAMAIFGTKAGVGLANSLQPGFKGLADYEVAWDDTGKHVNDAASAIQDTLPNKIKLGIGAALEQARGFATDFGPALMGASSLASVGTALVSGLKLDVALKKGWEGAIGTIGGSAAGQAGSAAVKRGSSALEKILLSALGTIGGAVGISVGTSIVGGVIAILTAPVTLTAIAAAVGGWAVLQVLQQKAAESAANYTTQQNAINDALNKGGDALDETAGQLAILQAAWGPMAEEAATGFASLPDAVAAAKDTLRNFGTWMGTGGVLSDSDIQAIYDRGVAAGKGAVTGFRSQTANADLGFATSLEHDTSFESIGEASARKVIKAILDTATREGHVSLQALGPALFEHDTSFNKIGTDKADEFGGGFDNGMAAYHHRNDWLTNFGGRGGPGDVAFHTAGVGAANTFSTSYADQIAHMSSSVGAAPARQLGVHFGEQYIVGFKSTADQAKSEWAQYLDDLAHPNRGQKTVGWIVGKLTGEDLARGLHSSQPQVRHSAEQERQNLLVLLQQMIDDGYTVGKKTLAKLGLGIQDGKIVAINAAKGAKTSVNNSLNSTDGVYQYGVDLVNRWAAGMAHAGINAATIAQGIVHRVGGVFLDDVPIPSTAPEHIRRIGEYGGHFIDRWIGGMWARGDAAARSAELLGSSIAGSLSGSLGPMQRLTGGGASIRHEHSGTVQVRLSGDTIAAARSQGASWDDIGRIARSANGLASGLQMRLSVNG